MIAEINKKYGKEINRVHFIGIGGISMSGFAEILCRKGYVVSGSDWIASDITRHLAKLGIDIKLGNDAEHITDDMDLVVYTAAVKPNNPEFAAAKQKNIPTMDRAQLMGIIMGDYAHSIAVAGVHGKTTTTAIISEVLLAAGVDPTISIGGFLESIGSNFRIGNSSYMVTETCEYFDSFLQVYPNVGIVLNVDSDHLDYFGTFERILESFHRFGQNISEDGTLIIHSDCPEQIRMGLKCNVITYGDVDSSQFWAKDLRYNSEGQPSFTIMDGQNPLAEVRLKLRGRHNVDNCLATAAMATVLGIPREALVKGLEKAVGARRRFEDKGSYNGIRIIDDYAHHPTEIKASLSSATSEGRIICAFQPHTYSRTQNYMEDFAKAFDLADIILILPVFASREVTIEASPNLLSKLLCENIIKNGKNALFVDNFQSAAEWIKANAMQRDLLITMGAGDIHILGEGLISGDL